MKWNNAFKNVSKVAFSKTTLLLVWLLVCVALLASTGTSMATMTSGTNGSSGADVAAFIIDVGSFTTDDIAINCNTKTTETSYKFWVTNEKNFEVSEVAMKYSIQVTLPSEFPSGITMDIDGVTGTTSSDKKVYTFEKDSAWYFQNGESTTNYHTLTFKADSSIVTQNYDFSGISIVVIAEQVN